MATQLYNIKTLEKFVLSKMNGHINQEMDQIIKNDAFLTYVVTGLEYQLKEQSEKNLDAFLTTKQQIVWQSLEQSYLDSHYALPLNKSKYSHLIKKYIEEIRYLKDEFHFHTYHYLMGFNCCCLLILVVTFLFISSLESNHVLNDNLNGVLGFKP